MNWEKVKDVAIFVFIWGLAVTLIEYQAESWVVETAGDLFGSLALMALAIERALRDEDTN